MADQQAGWYPDPSGDASKLRYWDGTQWTGNFTDTPAGVLPVQQTQPVQPLQPLQPAYPQAVEAQTSPYYSAGGQSPYYQPHVQPPASQTNGLAIAAMICGVVGLCPYTFCIISIVAIILGAIGIRKPNNKGLAIAGLILGIVGILVFIGILVFGLYLFDTYGFSELLEMTSSNR